MIEHKALELIQSTAIKANGVIPLQNTLIPMVALPAGVTLTSIEHLQAGRSRFRGTFHTSRLGEFTTYVEKRAVAAASNSHDNTHAPEPARSPVRVFVDADNDNACAFFNLGSERGAGHGDDKAVLSLDKTAAYSALLEINGERKSQREIAEFLEDWLHIIAPVYGEVEGTLVQAISAIRNIAIRSEGEATHKISDFGASKTALESIEANSRGTMPEGFRFMCRPYAGFNAQEFALRLSVIADKEAPKLVLRIVGLDAITEAIAAEFESIVRMDLDGTGCEVFRGTFITL